MTLTSVAIHILEKEFIHIFRYELSSYLHRRYSKTLELDKTEIRSSHLFYILILTGSTEAR